MPELPELDFSQYHPLDHWPFSARCRDHYGGGRHHLRIAWRFRRRDEVVGVFARVSTCVIGRHKWQVWRRSNRPLGEVLGSRVIGKPGDYMAACAYCHTTRTATEDEWW